MPARSKPERPTIPYEMLTASFLRSLEAANKSPRTLNTYGDAVRLFGAFLSEHGMSTDVSDIAREHVEAFIADQLSQWKPATANNRYRALQQFFKWLAVEGEIPISPMLNMTPPKVPETPPDVLGETQLRKLLKACDGKEFVDKRDKAILLLLIDTGMRRSELAGLAVDDIDFEHNVARVLGKGRRPRACPFGKKTAMALDRYIRARMSHRDMHRDELWLGYSGPMTANGVYQVVRARAEQAGLGKVYPHQLRHTFAHAWLASGGQENDLMRLTGWQSRTMLGRYGASAADERAREAYKRLSPADRL